MCQYVLYYVDSFRSLISRAWDLPELISQTAKCSVQTALQISHNNAGNITTAKILTFMFGR